MSELKCALDEVVFMWRPLRASVIAHPTPTQPDVVLKSLESLEFDPQFTLLSNEVVNGRGSLLASLAPDGSFALTALNSKIVLFHYQIDFHRSNASLNRSDSNNSIPSHLLSQSSVLKLPASTNMGIFCIDLSFTKDSRHPMESRLCLCFDLLLIH